MLDDPQLDLSALRATLARHYGLEARAVTFLPVGHDPLAAAYRVETIGGTPFFLKVHLGPLQDPALRVPRALRDAGIANVVAPIHTTSLRLWSPVGDRDDARAVLYPFLEAESASASGLTDAQWYAFGATLRAIHQSGLENQLGALLRHEDFSLPSAGAVRNVLEITSSATVNSPSARQLATFYRRQTARILAAIERAQALGRLLRATSLPRVLCHADIHLANVMVGADGRLWIVDWDAPLFAPPERDLLFVVGSRIVRPVSPQQEDHFFAGYGPTSINPVALIYFRYERILEDLDAFGRSVLLTPGLSEAAREVETEIVMSFFAPGGDIDRAEQVPRWRWPQETP